MASRLDVMQRLGRAMADPTRSRILSRLLDGPCNPAQLARDLHLTPSNVSNHLTCLRGCGLVVVTPQGRKASYEIADPHLVKALTALVDVVLAVDDGRPCADADCDVPLCCGPGTLAAAAAPRTASVTDGTEPASATDDTEPASATDDTEPASATDDTEPADAIGVRP